MLPNANAAAVAFMAIQAAGRVAAMLNFTAGAFNLIAACRTARIRTVLCSRGFVEKAKLEDLVAADGERGALRLARGRARPGERSSTSCAPSSIAAGRSCRASPTTPRRCCSPPARKGMPKGVVLTHANMLANISQIVARFDFTSADIAFNPLPIFHAFGLTGGLVLGLMTGMKVYLYPTPLHYRQIPELVYRINATALFGTDTFLAGYGAQRQRLRLPHACATSSAARSR